MKSQSLNGVYYQTIFVRFGFAADNYFTNVCFNLRYGKS